jgi:hypothetical protein
MIKYKIRFNTRIIIKIIYFIILIHTISAELYSQQRGKRILDILGQSAYSYLLSANRPSFSIDAYNIGKNKLSVSLSASYSAETFDFPVSLTYGLTNNIEISAGCSPYTQSYNFLGDKISGFGDSYVSLKFSFLESNNFIHAFQTSVKIPTANKDNELGTGKMDYSFAIAQGFNYKKFSYDLSLELNLLTRRDFPSIGKYPKKVQDKIDSIKNAYNYKFEPEIVVSVSPAYNIFNSAYIYSGFSFSRNTRLDFNTSTVFFGVSFIASKKLSISAGSSIGLEQTGQWGVFSSVNLLF